MVELGGRRAIILCQWGSLAAFARLYWVAPPVAQRPVLEIDFIQTAHAQTLKERCGEALQSGSTSEVSLQFSEES